MNGDNEWTFILLIDILIEKSYKFFIMYTVFIRNWWKKNPSWPNGLEPDPSARKTKLATFNTEKECIEYCKQYNATHDAGELSRKAEFTQYW